jgi:hypothetical protein
MSQFQSVSPLTQEMFAGLNLISHIDQRNVIKLKQIVVHFKTYRRTTFSIKLRPLDSIETVKKVVGELMGVDPERLNITRDGHPFYDNSMFLCDYRVQNGATLGVELVPHPRPSNQ